MRTQQQEGGASMSSGVKGKPQLKKDCMKSPLQKQFHMELHQQPDNQKKTTLLWKLPGFLKHMSRQTMMGSINQQFVSFQSHGMQQACDL